MLRVALRVGLTTFWAPPAWAHQPPPAGEYQAACAHQSWSIFV